MEEIIMTDLIYSLYMLHTFDEGIIPLRNFDEPRLPEEIQADLIALSPEKARKAKRKFRKMWRKCMKNQGSRSTSRCDVVDQQIMSKARRTFLGC